jgi:hypothetical protein
MSVNVAKGNKVVLLSDQSLFYFLNRSLEPKRCI